MAASEAHGWMHTGTLTRFGDFDFEGGYPSAESGARLLEQLTFNRAIEVYLTQMMRVSETALRERLRAFGAGFLQDGLQRYLTDVGLMGSDQGKGG